MNRAAVAALALLMLSGCLGDSGKPDRAQPPATASAADPLEMGALEVVALDYDFGPFIVTDPTFQPYQYPVNLQGNVHLPASAGPFPVAFFMHGRHSTCRLEPVGFEFLGSPICPETTATEPVDSYTGYDELAALLASHGYAVISASANGVNDRDNTGDSGANARAQLTLETLARFQAANETGGSALDALRGQLDFSHVGLMGHSRGGEGVMRATTLNVERGRPFAIDAIFALAPTDFRRWPLADDTAFATLLPYCDGDVSNLQGGWMYDDAREALGNGSLTLRPGQLLAHVVALGANHNFYNTVWTGDDNGGSSDPWCGADEPNSGRDSPQAQRAHGYGVMAAFFRLFLGGEEAFRPFWTGAQPWPAAMCPEQDGGCADRVLTSAFLSPDAQRIVSLRGDDGEELYGMELEACPPQCPGRPTLTVARQSAASGPAGAGVLYRVAGAAGFTQLSLRAGVPVGGEDVALRVVFSTQGVDFPVDVAAQAALRAPPGDDEAKTLLNMVRAPMPVGLDAGAIDAIYLVFPEGGTLQFADVAFT